MSEFSALHCSDSAQSTTGHNRQLATTAFETMAQPIEEQVSHRCELSQADKFRNSLTPSVVCSPDHDLILRSSDHVRFLVHRHNLETHSEAFAPPPRCSSSTYRNEVVDLIESSSVLELLLQYMYRQPQPDLTSVCFSDLKGLAEAVEKYQVYSAMEICKMMMW
jgi:BTB/POZ domain